MNRAVDKLIYLNSISEADAYIGARKSAAPDSQAAPALCIALRPSVYSFLRQRGAVVHNTSLYFTNNSHVSALERSRMIVDWLRQRSELDGPDADVAQSYREIFIFLARRVIHTYLWAIEIVTNSIEAHRPCAVSASLAGRRCSSELSAQPEEKYLGRFVATLAAGGLRFEDIHSAVDGDVETTAAASSGPLDIIFKHLCRSVRFDLLGAKMTFTGTLTGKKPIALTTTSYNMADLAKKLQDDIRDRSFFFLPDIFFPPYRGPRFLKRLLYGSCLEDVENEKRLLERLALVIKEDKEVFSYRGVSFSDCLSEKIEGAIADFMLGCVYWTDRLRRFMDAGRTSLFICGGNRLEDVILAELSRRKNLAAVLISHGSHVRPKNDSEFIEWAEHGRTFLRAEFSHHALQSPLAEGYLETFPTSGRVVRTGPVIWGMPADRDRGRALFSDIFGVRRDPARCRVVLHAGTPKPTSSLRFYVYETPDEYIQGLRDLANAVRNIPDAFLIIKFRPSQEISVRDLKGLVPFSEKVILNVDKPFLDLLGMANLFVSYSSTAIEEALQNRIPVLLYGGRGRYQHVPAEPVECGRSVTPRAVHHVKEAKDLEYAISALLKIDMNRVGGEDLFLRYIYRREERTPIADLIRMRI